MKILFLASVLSFALAQDFCLASGFQYLVRPPEDKILNLSKMELYPNQWVPHVPSSTEKNKFLNKLTTLKRNHPDGLNIVIWDSGSINFLDNLSNAIFVAPSIDSARYRGEQLTNEANGLYGQCLFFKSTLSDFLYFLKNDINFHTAFRKSVRIFCDHQDVISNELLHNYNDVTTPIHPMHPKEKIDFISDLLNDNGKIITSVINLNRLTFPRFSLGYDIEFLSDDVQYDIKKLETTTRSKKDLWILHPQAAFFEVFKIKIAHLPYSEVMERWGMTEEDYKRLENLFAIETNEAYRSFTKRMVEIKPKQW